MSERLTQNDEWRRIPGFRDYEASADGRIRRLGALKPLRTHGLSKGYHVATLPRVIQGETIWRTQKVHRLVALAFYGVPQDGYECNHINGNKLDNHASNLEWVTRSRNSIHAIELGLKKVCSKRKLTESQVAEILSLGESMSTKELTIKFKVERPTIRMILRKKAWKHITNGGRSIV